MTLQTFLDFFGQYGYWFILAVCYCEYLNLPGFPAGVIMPALGILAGQSDLNLLFALVLSIVAGTLASLTIYAICRFGGAPLLHRLFGKSPKFSAFVDQCHARIRHGGNRALFVCRLIPVLRTIVSIPAGLLAVPVRDYTIWSAAGIACWNTALIAFGYFGGGLVIGWFG
ncbi:MAG: DedA family protein [Butyricicoccus sp.]|nr:DedA family protein [Butyricicoccus pullicaecorum]MCI6719472.1 DedA family protein [Clostridiales bacterium]MDY5972750.1 DedA family protein [Butyricicoccus sp.]